MLFNRGGTVHRCHGSVRTSVRGSRFNTISVQQKKIYIYLLCSVSFHLFLTDSCTNYYFFHLDVKILNIITLCNIYKKYVYIWVGTVQLFHGSVCIMVLESRFRHDSV